MSELNKIGLTKADYQGGKSTLCTGCGHDSITSHLVTALHQASVDPYTITKLSGIGCSSKTPAYFVGRAFGLNGIHGRMAPIATGVHLAHRHQRLIGVSGDGDTASIGLGSFVHALRRNVPMLYLIENNGVYGLTKGQFSATAEAGSMAKDGRSNHFRGLDLCALALEVGCSFVARSFSGDPKQLVPLLNAALRHQGTAVIDVISPCITFANHEGSASSFDAVKARNRHLQDLGFIQSQPEVTVDYEPGTTRAIELHDGSRLVLRKLNEVEHDVANAEAARRLIKRARGAGELLTGLFYWNQNTVALADAYRLGDRPLRDRGEETRPSASALDEILADYD